eukprot:scaffold351_cov248-Pinguiococcus_pyrenoidosus.AAC.7
MWKDRPPSQPPPPSAETSPSDCARPPAASWSPAEEIQRHPSAIPSTRVTHPARARARARAGAGRLQRTSPHWHPPEAAPVGLRCQCSVGEIRTTEPIPLKRRSRAGCTVPPLHWRHWATPQLFRSAAAPGSAASTASCFSCGSAGQAEGTDRLLRPRPPGEEKAARSTGCAGPKAMRGRTSAQRSTFPPQRCCSSAARGHGSRTAPATSFATLEAAALRDSWPSREHSSPPAHASEQHGDRPASPPCVRRGRAPWPAPGPPRERERASRGSRFARTVSESRGALCSSPLLGFASGY